MLFFHTRPVSCVMLEPWKGANKGTHQEEAGSAPRRMDMKFIKGEKYRIFTHAPHLVVSVSRKGEGNLQLAEPSTSNPHTDEVVEVTDELEYIGRVEIEGSKGKVPTFKTPAGTLVQGHRNNFDPETEYNKDRTRTRSEAGAEGMKVDTIAQSLENIFSNLLARDAKAALELATKFEKMAAEVVADQVVDSIIEAEVA